MGALDRLAQRAGEGNAVGQYTFLDADTLRDPEDRNITYRLQGLDAPETSKFTKKGKLKEFDGKQQIATAGAGTATTAISGLAQDQGFHNLVKLKNPDGSPKMDATGSRQLVELRDKEGRSFSQELLKAGVLDAGKYTSQADLEAAEVAKRFGNDYAGADEFNQAAIDVGAAVKRESPAELLFKQAALSEAGVAEGLGTSNIAWRKTDRDINNNSRNPLSDAWEMGWIGAKEGAYGFLELLGESTDVDYLQDIGEAGIARAQAQQQEYGKVLTDWKDVEGFKSGVQYIANNAAMSLPYMVTTAGATVAGGVAAPVIGTAGAIGFSIAAPATIYAGQVWNEMEGEKSAGIALGAGLAQASLERLGIGIIAGKIPAKAIPDEAIKKIMSSTGATKEAASAMLANATKQELAGFMQDSAKIAAKQVTAKRAGQEILKGAAKGALGEGSTEVMQEAIAYTAAVKGSDKKFDWEELNERLTAAAIAGSTLGAGFATPGSINTLAKERAAYGDNVLADQTTATNAGLWVDEEKNAHGYVATNQENLAKIHTENALGRKGLTLDERAQSFDSQQRKRTTEEKARDAFTSLPSLWRGATRNIFSDDLMQRSRSARIAADLFGGNPDRVFSGASFEDAKHHKVAQYKNMIDIPNKVYYAMNGGKKFTTADKGRISDQVYTSLRNAVTQDGKFDPQLLPDGPHKQMIAKLGTDLNALADKMHTDQAKHNPELGKLDNYLFKYKTMNKRAVHQNSKKFEDLLVSKHGINRAEAKEITDRITDDPNVGDIDEAFSVVKGGIVPSSHKKRTLGLSEDKDFAEFMENDLFANVSHAAKSAARYSAHRDFIGQNGEVVSNLLDKIQQELGNTPEAQAQVDKIAKQMKDYLDAESGNYKRPKSEFGKKAQKIQKHAMMFMTFSGLPLATFSSIVELALVGRGLKQNQIFGKDKLSLETQGKDFAKGMLRYMEGIKDTVQDKTGYSEDTENQARLREMGFYEWDVGAATVTGVTETNAWQQKAFDSFFRVNGLTQYTDYTRSLRASFAGDFIFDNLRQVADQRRGGTPYTKTTQETEAKLRNIGINIDALIPLQEKITAGAELTPQEQGTYDTMIRDATFSFVNDAIVLPQAGNRPLIYQDPRFALFTQFQGFLSTFTTKVLPKLWKDAMGGTTPTMQYQAWATMATMVMLGFVSQHMKDYLKYETEIGDDDFEDKTGKNPYLETPEYIRRGLLSTGLLGTGERVINAMFPIYETRSENAGDWLFNQAVGESPALGYVQRVAGATGALAQGDVGKATEQAFKAAPIFGPFSSFNREIGKLAGDWNFNGGQ